LPHVCSVRYVTRMSIAALTQYIVAAMISWVPLGNQIERANDGHWMRDSQGLYVVEDPAVARARYERIAGEIVSIAFDEANPPLFRGEEGRLKTALLLASIASFEGGYHKWVEDGTCNTRLFLADHPRECDGGAAWSNWQLHMYRYVIRSGEMTQAQYLENSLVPEDREWIKDHADSIIRGPDVARDPKLAVQVAYYLVRYSEKNFRSLCAYSGEDCSGSHPKATARLERAAAYLRAHPFTMPEEASPEAREEAIRKQVLEIVAGVHAPERTVVRLFALRSVPSLVQARLD
jgi:hypothetical protein